MAKRRAINRGYRPIRNANMIGKGGKQLKPVKGSWVKGHAKAMGASKPKTKPAPAKAPMKSKTGFVAKKSYLRKPTAKAVNPPTAVKKQGSRKLNKVARRPVPKVTMKSRKPARKPPTRGR